MQTILITGGTGLIGKHITQKLLQNGFRVIVLSRTAHMGTEGIEYARWDIQERYIDEWAVKDADCIIHLAGANIAGKRWTKARMNELVESRVMGALFLQEQLRLIPNKVQLVISATGTGWYGNDITAHKSGPFIESDPPSEDFIGKLCKEWENAVKGFDKLASRTVIFRLGAVLSNKGGFLYEFQNKLKFGFAPILGRGNQIISWIHIDDLMRIFINAINDENYKGIYNAVAPYPVSQRHFIKKLAEKLKGRFSIPVFVPPFVLKLILGKLSSELLKSTTVSSQKISSVFQFQYPTLTAALDSFYSKNQ